MSSVSLKAREVYASLRKLPSVEWAASLSRVDPEVKKEILSLIRAKGSVKLPAPVVVQNEEPNPEGVKMGVDENCLLKKEEREEDPEREKKELEEEMCFHKIYILSTEMLGSINEVLGMLMFAAGDEASPDSASIEVVGRYLAVWMCALWAEFTAEVMTEKQNSDGSINTKRRTSATAAVEFDANNIWQYDRTTNKVRYFLEKRFPFEYQKFLSLHHRSSTGLRSHSPPDPTTVPSTLSRYLMSTERFDQRRELRDERTEKFTRAEYSAFSFARSVAMKSGKIHIAGWLHACCAAQSPGPVKAKRKGGLIPKSVMDFLVFLLNDRIAILVETALRLRLFYKQDDPTSSNKSTNSLVYEELSHPSELPLLSSASAGCIFTGPIIPLLYRQSMTLIAQLVDSPTLVYTNKTDLLRLLRSDEFFSGSTRAVIPSVVKGEEIKTVEEDEEDAEERGENEFRQRTLLEVLGVSEEKALALGSENFFNLICSESMKTSRVDLLYPPLDEFAVYAFFQGKTALWTRRGDQTLHSIAENLRQQMDKDRETGSEEYLTHRERYKMLLQYNAAILKIARFADFLVRDTTDTKREENDESGSEEDEVSGGDRKRRKKS